MACTVSDTHKMSDWNRAQLGVGLQMRHNEIREWDEGRGTRDSSSRVPEGSLAWELEPHVTMSGLCEAPCRLLRNHPYLDSYGKDPSGLTTIPPLRVARPERILVRACKRMLADAPFRVPRRATQAT